jgi:ribose 5-phosphate isomerase B
MRVAISADHAGLGLKREIAARLSAAGHRVSDLGTRCDSPDESDDYPDHAEAVCDVVLSGGAERGILICGSGVGASIAANRIPGVRAGLCHDTYSARQGVEHDDVNVLVLGARVVGVELAMELVRSFLAARFSGEPRHVRRLRKVEAVGLRHAPGGRRKRVGGAS